MMKIVLTLIILSIPTWACDFSRYRVLKDQADQQLELIRNSEWQWGLNDLKPEVEKLANFINAQNQCLHNLGGNRFRHCLSSFNLKRELTENYYFKMIYRLMSVDTSGDFPSCYFEDSPRQLNTVNHIDGNEVMYSPRAGFWSLRSEEECEFNNNIGIKSVRGIVLSNNGYFSVDFLEHPDIFFPSQQHLGLRLKFAEDYIGLYFGQAGDNLLIRWQGGEWISINGETLKIEESNFMNLKPRCSTKIYSGSLGDMNSMVVAPDIEINEQYRQSNPDFEEIYTY